MWNHWSRLELHICVSREKNRIDSRQEIYWWRSRPTLGMCWRRHMFILPTRENKGNQRNLENKDCTRKPWSKYGANWNDTNVEQFRYQKKEFIWIFPFEGNRIWTMEVQRGKCNYSWFWKEKYLSSHKNSVYWLFWSQPTDQTWKTSLRL